MRGSVGNSGNQGGRRLDVFRLGVFGVETAVAPPLLFTCANYYKQKAKTFVKNIYRTIHDKHLYSKRLVLKCAVQWEIVGIKAEGVMALSALVFFGPAIFANLTQFGIIRHCCTSNLYKLHKNRSISFGDLSLAEPALASTLLIY
ncbi:MAG: hypothetical protein KC433_10605 [Anaerolineales bacterium]|nr:hypothetical protein [Anaerolineales bacterium]MCB8936868.1 hypothetical protein [Ardenticatenaceae bacterium]